MCKYMENICVNMGFCQIHYHICVYLHDIHCYRKIRTCLSVTLAILAIAFETRAGYHHITQGMGEVAALMYVHLYVR